jgi:hypothetical protein
MSPYRQPALPAPTVRPRFERALSLALTRVRLSDERVRVDAPDAMALISIVGALGALGLPLAWSAVGAWALAALVAVVLTTRVHLRVRPGRALLVRTILGVPWWVSRRGREAPAEWTDWDFDGDDLVLPRTVEQATEGHGRLVVLTTSLHGVSGAEIDEIARACEAVLRR